MRARLFANVHRNEATSRGSGDVQGNARSRTSARHPGLIAKGRGKSREIAVDVNAVIREELDGVAEELGTVALHADEANRLGQAVMTLSGVSEVPANVREMRERLWRQNASRRAEAHGARQGSNQGDRRHGIRRLA